MREASQKVIAAVSKHMRKIHLAQLMINGGGSKSEFSALTGEKDWITERIFAAAKRRTPDKTRRDVVLCSECAFLLNSGRDYDALTELVAQLIS